MPGSAVLMDAPVLLNAPMLSLAPLTAGCTVAPRFCS